MALGDGGNYGKQNEQNKERFRPTVYSPVCLKNPDAKIEGSELSFKFWKGLLGIQISPKNDRKPGDTYDTYNHKGGIIIYLTHVKARLFYKGILAMLKDDTIPNVSVASGSSGLITFSNGKEFGVDHYMIIIRNVDPQSGTVVESYSYEINGSGYNYITNYNEQTAEHDRVLVETLELEMILDILEQYFKSMNYAVAYTIVDSLQYDFARVNNGVNLLLENAGIERKSNKSQNPRAKSFFDSVRDGERESSSSSKTTKSSSLDDLAIGFTETDYDEDDDLPF